jgi:hypothetical protein
MEASKTQDRSEEEIEFNGIRSLGELLSREGEITILDLCALVPQPSDLTTNSGALYLGGRNPNTEKAEAERFKHEMTYTANLRDTLLSQPGRLDGDIASVCSSPEMVTRYREVTIADLKSKVSRIRDPKAKEELGALLKVHQRSLKFLQRRQYNLELVDGFRDFLRHPELTGEPGGDRNSYDPKHIPQISDSSLSLIETAFTSAEPANLVTRDRTVLKVFANTARLATGNNMAWAEHIALPKDVEELRECTEARLFYLTPKKANGGYSLDVTFIGGI